MRSGGRGQVGGIPSWTCAWWCGSGWIDPTVFQDVSETSGVRGPLLVIAGAGTGESTVLTRRVARLVRDGYAQASEL